MKPKHTPGKWSAQYFTDSTTLIKAENHTKAIAEVRGTNIKANAALIAAAPEMFEALLIAKKLLDETRQGNNYLERGQVNKTLCKALGLDYSSIKTEEFESILKKARGE